MRKRAQPSAALREALWVSRCVGQPETAPLQPTDIQDLARYLHVRNLEAGEPLHRLGAAPSAVCIVRDGCLELAVPSSSSRIVIQTLRAGEIDGDIQLLLGMPMPYETRANTATTCLLLEHADFEELLATHPPLSRRWLTSVAQRLARSHSRLANLLGQPLEMQIAQLLLDESVDDVVALTQTTLAALLGVRRPSVNRVLRRLAKRGLVQPSYGSVHIVNRVRLTAIASTR
jgi:CRP-like cAMP-binding protein